MRRLNKRKTAIILIVMIMLLVEIIILGLSRANNIKEIHTTIIDYGEKLEDDNLILDAINSGKDSYYVVLPDMINNKVVTSYYVALRNDGQSEETTATENVESGEINVDEEAQINTVIEDISNTSTTLETTKQVQMEKKPGDKLYLTATEIEEQKLNVIAKYDEKEKNGQLLYNKHLEQIIDDKNVTVEGYMPADAILTVEVANEEKTKEALKDVLNKDITYKIAYDIKLLSNEKEYNPTDFDENVKVSISGVDAIDKENQKYKVVHIDNENKIEEIEKIELKDNEVVFDASSFSTYALLLDDSMNLENLATYASVEATLVSGKDVWDGTVATSFKYGDGNAATPYLIRNCAELAYLRDNVNSGNTYSGKYFQLVNDLDLNGKEWTPIGTIEQPFQGVFDGAGYVIANAKITISSMPTAGIASYGFFGSIGGGTTQAIVKNVQFSKIQISITATTDGGGTSLRGYHIGTVAGTLYKNSVITNNLIKSCTIADKNSMRIQNNSCRVAIGGIAGFVANKYDSSLKVALDETDPGTGARYEISKCFADVEISSTICATDLSSIGQFSTAGIVGIISSQPVWPDTCLYVGKITSNGFTGPIFGYLKGSTSYTTSTNFPILWNGNDIQKLTMTSYYNSYSVNGTGFTSTETAGDSSSSVDTDKTKVQYVQGVNKGIYVKDISTLTGGMTEIDKGIGWKYESGTYVLTKRFNNELIDDTTAPTYKVNVENTNTPLTYTWYVNDVLQSGVTENSITQNASWDEGYNIDVVIKDSGNYYDVINLEISQITLDIEFNINTTTNTVTASLVGTGLDLVNLSDYTYQWYTLDVSGVSEKIINGATTTTLTNLENGLEYKLVATNTNNANLSRENSFVYGTRTVIYVDYAEGSNTNDGLTPETAVKTMVSAYMKLSSSGDINTNIIVVIGKYTATVFSASTNANMSKPATITGAYGGTDYQGNLLMAGDTAGRFLVADTAFEHLEFRGSFTDGTTASTNLYLQGYSLTMGRGVTMSNYNYINIGTIPDFNVYAGWRRYNYATLPRNNSHIIIESGQYGTIALGGNTGTNAVSNLSNTTSNNFTGSSSSDTFSVTLDIEYEQKLKQYDIGYVIGGSTLGNIYANQTINIKNGVIYELIGGSLGDSSNRPTDWNYPLNTFIGSTTINIIGGSIDEVCAGSMGGNISGTSIVGDSYFYGTITVNMSKGEIVGNLYGAGCGSVTGYNAKSSDPYSSYGQSVTTTTNINISGGTIGGDIYGGGYAYSEKLTEATTPDDGGALFGDSNITISGSPTISGNIYGAGRGNNFTSKTYNATVIGNSNITLGGTPTITGAIYGGGNGIISNPSIAELTGETNINITTSLENNIYGGGNYATTNETNVYLKSGTTTGNIYGGGKNAQATTTHVYIQGGTASTIYGGSDSEGNVRTTNINGTSGTVSTIYGGNYLAGVSTTTNVTINGTKISTAIYGGGNQATTTTTNITLTNSTSQIPLVYGGGKNANVTTTNINCNGASINNVYGGSGDGGNINKTNVKINSSTVTTVYGGNSNGGTVTQANIIGTGGQVANIYGGGSKTSTGTTTSVDTTTITINGTKITSSIYGAGRLNSSTGTTNVTLTSSSATIPNVYGGGYSTTSGVTTTNVNCNGATITNVYGGSSNGGNVDKTNIKINSGTVNNIYGGNYNSGEVTQSTNIIMQGGTISNSMYGGGRGTSSKVGTTENSATSNVNIVKGTINGSIYGGGYNSVIYGDANIKIGKDAVNDSTLTDGDINIAGNIYGGAKATTTSHIGVTGNADVNINGNEQSITISNSIFGDGENSTVSETKNITIKNYGTSTELKQLVSIEKATQALIENSAIHLIGGTNEENKYNSVKFTLNKIDHLKLANNSTIYLDNGANLLKAYSSILLSEDGTTETLETAKIEGIIGTANENTVTTNVDNRIYILQGNNLNIATNEDVTQYGTINGMTYLGMYTSSTNPTGTITLTGTDNVYVLAQHKANHNTELDGFYTNLNSSAYKYVGVTPQNTGYYIWLIGTVPQEQQLETDITASKYTTIGTVELPLTTVNSPNTVYNVSKIDGNLATDVSIKDRSLIPTIASTEEKANTTFALEMKTGVSAWTSNAITKFFISAGATSGSYSGSTEYLSDNSTQVPNLVFNIYNSQNISEDADLGFVTIGITVLKPETALKYNVSELAIKINIKTSIEQENGYATGIAPGEKFVSEFETIETNITDSSEFSTYYTLGISNFTNYKYNETYSTYHRALISRDSYGDAFVLPSGTKITMLDMVTNKYYYYIVTTSDQTAVKYVYNLSEFLEMGTTNRYYDEAVAVSTYLDSSSDSVTERFVFHVDFKEGELSETKENNTLYLELRNSEEQTIINVLGTQRDTCKYGVYVNKDAILDTKIQEIPTTIGLGDDFNIKVSSTFTQQLVNEKTIYDTQYLDKKMGITINIWSVANATLLNGQEIMGITYEINGTTYYPNVNGTARIKVSENVSNVISNINVHTGGNKTLSTGDYVIIVDTLASADGEYYERDIQNHDKKTLTIKNSTYGLKITVDDQDRIIEKGKTSITVNMEKSVSNIENPTFNVKMYRRDYSEENSTTYNETISITAQAATPSFEIAIPTDIKTGTYKIIVELYDGDIYVGEAYDYFIVK
ncbi:MAG: beta strand repeat-containing protein [Clostridia bacterium]